MKRATLILVSVLLVAAGVWFFCHEGINGALAGKSAAPVSAAARKSGAAVGMVPSGVTARGSLTDTNSFTNRLAFRLANTKKTIGRLQHDRHAILLENAFIDTGLPLSLNLPLHLQASGDPGAYIVQANGKIDHAFRAVLVAAGAQIVSYIPNNAYLVRLNAGNAKALTSSPLVQAVLPYEPYYKISSSAPVKIVAAAAAYSPAQKAVTNTTTLLQLAVAQKSLPPGTFLTLGLFGDDATATIAQIEKLGGKVLSGDRSPFGKIVRVQPPADWVALADLAGVQLVEPAYLRKRANDVARVAVGVSTDTVTNADYLNLTGKNVMVEMNDTGVDPTHPDFSVGGSAAAPGTVPPSRVSGDSAGSLYDTEGHGTHVAGIIAGNGSGSLHPTAVGAVLAALGFGSVTNADFRGKAPDATLFSVGGIEGNDTVPVSDSYFQEQPALTNALISNNSWANNGDNAYDLSAAGYDAATRDALPGVPGSQPVLFVFAAGNDGTGSDNGGSTSSGIPDSITSPGTAKNVITVGALEQPRNITNIVTVINADGSTNTYEPWAAETDTGYEVAGYSGRGNVGIETEGAYGRFKPDVVAPGTFVVSTRSSMWDTNAYYNNPTNYDDAPFSPYTFQTLAPAKAADYYALAPDYTVGVYVYIVPNVQSAMPFPNLPLYISLTNIAPSAASYDIYSTNDAVSIPPDTGGSITDVTALRGNFFNIGVTNNTSQPVNYDLYIVFATTNNVGDYFQVLSNMNNQIGPYYRYESGTSMATPSVSGVLADMQDFFTNTLHTTPSPALLKALLINGARATIGYNYQVQNDINFEGWGLVNLPNSIPATLVPTNAASTVTNMFFVDQSPTNALATGDRQTYSVVLSPAAEAQSFRVTLAWTDPPGNPAAAIKLVNNLELVVTNLDDPANPVIFYGNDIGSGNLFNTPESTNTPAVSVVDTINNVQNVYIQAGTGTNFTVTVIGVAVNVNAVNAQTNDWTAGTYAPNMVQDFALVIASGDGPNTNGFTITGVSNVINPTNGQNITIISTNNLPLLNQFAGASSPLLGTNEATFAAGSGGALYGSQAVVTIGQTNQCHFYIVTNNGLDASTGLTNLNNANVTNAAFVTFSPATAAIPREGVYAGYDANSTRPEADVDIFVTTDSNLLTLSPVTISNCINSGPLGATINTGPGSAFQGSSLGRGGSEFVVDTNSQVGEIYYVCVQSEDQMAAEYDFLTEFSSVPFSLLNNGDETVNFFPVIIPDGNSTHPGRTSTLGLAIYPIETQRVVVTNVINQQNSGDIVESLNHSSASAGNSAVVLYNHTSPNLSGSFTNIYDDSGQGDIPGAQTSAGPGTLNEYITKEGSGVWLLNGSDDAPGFNTTISATMFIQHHKTLGNPPLIVSIAPDSWFYGYVDVPVGYTNLFVFAIDETPDAPYYLTLAQKFNALPTLTGFDASVLLTNLSSNPPGLSNSISTGPPLTPGIYYVGIYNPDPAQTHLVEVGATLAFDANAIGTVTYDSTDTPANLPDDAVSYDSIHVTNTDIIQGINVGLRVDHPRISDLAFTLISPDGSRYLLMENRGGTTTNGCGGDTVGMATVLESDFNGTAADYFTGQTVAGWAVVSNQVSVVTDPANAYQGTNFLALANGVISNNLQTIIGNQYTLTLNYRGPGIVSWWRAENNANDSINGNNGILMNGATYTPGEVGNSFLLNNAHGYVLIQTVNTTLDVGQDAGFTIEGWICPSNNTTAMPILEYERALGTSSGADVGVHYFINEQPAGGTGNGSFYANIIDTSGGSHVITSAPGLLAGNGTWHHVALTYNKISGNAALYLDGNVESQTNISSFTPQTTFNNLLLGARTTFGSAANPVQAFFGKLDEISVSGRTLSSSEIKAIYQAGSAGKFNPSLFTLSASSSLAEAGVTVGGVNNILVGNNTNWQTNIVTFTATQTNTPLVINGIEPGILMADITLTTPVTNYVYLTFTEDTNLTITPIKFAPLPLVPTLSSSTSLPVIPTNAPILLGPTLNPENGHYYYLLQSTNWTASEACAEELGGHLATIRNSSENAWVLNTFSQPTPGTYVDLWIGLFDPNNDTNQVPAIHGTNFVWSSLEAVSYRNWNSGEPNNGGGFAFSGEYWTYMSSADQPAGGLWNDLENFSSITDSSFHTLNGVVEVVPTIVNSSLYYQPEQPLTPLIGTGAYGPWQLEILDSRAGATNNAVLDSWQIQFTFANTNLPAYTVGNLAGGIPAMNSVAANSIVWYAVPVPANAGYATNLLLYATNLPVNVWFSTNYPPTITNSGELNLIPDSTGNTNSPAVLSTNTVPAITPGGIYYLGVQNTNSATVNFGIQVNFDHGNSTNSTLPLVLGSVTWQNGSLQLQWTGSTNAQFQVLWTTNLTTPMNVWNVTTNGISTAGNNTWQFVDPNPTNAERFYRLEEMPQ